MLRVCHSVVSFNSTIHRAQSSIISYFGFRFTSAYNEVLFCSLWHMYPSTDIMTDDCCHKHTRTVKIHSCVTICCYEQTPMFDVINIVDTWNCWWHISHIAPTARYWSKTPFLPQLRHPHQNIAITFGTEKLEWRGYLTVATVWQYDYLLEWRGYLTVATVWQYDYLYWYNNKHDR